MFISEKFETFIAAFSRSHQLFVDGSKVMVATSAGVDSIALLYVLSRIPSLEISILHFNHGTRPENEIEEKLIKKISKDLGLELFIHRFDFNLYQSNFENIARLSRLKIYKGYIQKGYLIATAHHLDDSFEWSVMQKLKQSSLKSSLGIPVFSNGIIRPFMCVSKKQIIQYARNNKLQWYEDKSNLNIIHERNYIRIKLIEDIKKRYPQYLKHYVYQQNQLAELLQVHRLIDLKRSAPFIKINHFITGIVVCSKYLEFYRPEIIEIVQSLSSKKRGKLSIVIDQIFESVKKIRDNPREKKFHGPYFFTGGVLCYLFHDRLYFVKQSEIYRLNEIDQVVLSSLNNSAQITCNFINNHKLEYFPNLFIGNKNFVLKKVSRLKFDFFTQTIIHLQKSDIPYSFGVLEA